MEMTYLTFLIFFLAYVSKSEQSCPYSCGTNAICNDDTEQCECLDGFTGWPLVECYPKSSYWCSMVGDPKIFGFSGDNTRVKINCKAHFARFDIAANAPYGPFTDGEEHSANFDEDDCAVGRCRVVVLTDIELSPGFQYYVGDTYMKIVVNKGTPESDSVGRIRVRMNANRAEFSKKKMNNSWSAWKTLKEDRCKQVNVSSATFSICHSNGAWSVKTHDCGELGILYRPWNSSEEHQTMTAGVAIAAMGDPICEFNSTHYPHSFCDDPEGSPTVYGDFKREKGFTTRWASTIYALLTHPVNQDKDECLEIQNDFDSCDASQVDAVDACSNITVYWPHCAYAKNEDPLKLFDYCLWAYCNSDESFCDIIADVVVVPGVAGCPTSRPNFGC